jgi:Tfp pilus assembly protein FimV
MYFYTAQGNLVENFATDTSFPESCINCKKTTLNKFNNFKCDFCAIDDTQNLNLPINRNYCKDMTKCISNSSSPLVLNVQDKPINVGGILKSYNCRNTTDLNDLICGNLEKDYRKRKQITDTYIANQALKKATAQQATAQQVTAQQATAQQQAAAQQAAAQQAAAQQAAAQQAAAQQAAAQQAAAQQAAAQQAAAQQAAAQQAAAQQQSLQQDPAQLAAQLAAAQLAAQQATQLAAQLAAQQAAQQAAAQQVQLPPQEYFTQQRSSWWSSF